MAGRIGYNGGIVTDGIVFHLDIAKYESYPKDGSIWYDLSTNKKTVTFYNQGGSTYTLNSTGAPSFINDTATSFQFDGSNDFGRINTQSQFTSNVTVSAWVKTTSTKDQGILAHCNGGPSSVGYGMSNGKMYYQYYTGPWQYLLSTTTSLNDGNWKNLVWAKSVTNMKQYINGTLDSDSTLVGNVTANIQSIGCFWGPCSSDGYGAGTDSYASVFNGNIAYIIVYNKQLSATEVTQNYNALKNRFGL